MHSAAALGHNSTLEVLLEQGNSPNVIRNSTTPLTISCSQGNTAAVLLLLASGADPDLIPGAALHFSATREFHHITFALLAAGADASGIEPSDFARAALARPDLLHRLPRGALPFLSSLFTATLEELAKEHRRREECFYEDSERIGNTAARQEQLFEDTRPLLDCAASLVLLGADKASLSSLARSHLESRGF